MTAINEWWGQSLIERTCFLLIHVPGNNERWSVKIRFDGGRGRTVWESDAAIPLVALNGVAGSKYKGAELAPINGPQSHG